MKEFKHRVVEQYVLEYLAVTVVAHGHSDR